MGFRWHARVDCIFPGIFGDDERGGRVSSDDLVKDLWSDTKPEGFKTISALEADSRLIGRPAARGALQVLLQESEDRGDLLRYYVMCIGYR